MDEYRFFFGGFARRGRTTQRLRNPTYTAGERGSVPWAIVSFWDERFMNAFERLLCSSSLWRHLTERHLLPRILSGACLGDHLLELGAGYGAATCLLRSKIARVTSLEYDLNSLLKGKLDNEQKAADAVCGDASQLPFADQTFSSALAILVLHHLNTAQLQDRLFAECFRVLGSGGVFLAFDIPDGWLHRMAHIRSTFTPIDPVTVSARLASAGFVRSRVEIRNGGFLLTAMRS